ncbi:unnamed protein product [Orchesella dallaii]|uniref:Uncharacterized protein n=1 Tax=Orchesella dallaii TaxID=48710 RepID=A0ABP1R648_9HEXA
MEAETLPVHGACLTVPAGPTSESRQPDMERESTVMAADGRKLTRRSFAACGEDDATSVSSRTPQSNIRSAARSSRLEENKVEIQRLQLESQQLEASMKQRIIRMQTQVLLLNQENGILDKQQ